jgi:hypothetical protein
MEKKRKRRKKTKKLLEIGVFIKLLPRLKNQR